jgi:hypothetical protein|nr:hypothetical protein [uncultured Rhodopila sp.]
MSKHVPANTSRLFSISGTFGEAQIVASRSRILIDLQTRNYDSGGILRKHHALANLPLATASQLRDLLNQAIAAAADAPQHQPGLWSDATTGHTAQGCSQSVDALHGSKRRTAERRGYRDIPVPGPH